MMLSTMPIPDSDDILVLVPAEVGLGCVASITRRWNDGSVMWTALPPGVCRRTYGRPSDCRVGA
jgi:hypothetical protein